MFPVGIRQNKMIRHVVKRFVLDAHSQAMHMRKVRRRQNPRIMYLRKEHFLGRTFRGPPVSDLSEYDALLANGLEASCA